MANPDDSTAQALSISKGLRGKLEKREKTVKELEALMNKHLGIQMALDGQAAFEGWFGTPDHPEHEAAMASTFKARDACDKIVMEQFYISYSQDALSKAEKSLGQVLSQFTKALDASNSIKGRKNLPSTATKQDLAEVWVWLKLASLPASDASNIVDTSTVEQALLTEPMLGDSARIKEYHTKFEHLRSLAQGRTNDLSEKQKTLALESATTHEAVGTGLTAIQDLRWNMFLDKVDRPEGTDTAQG
ncbi:Fc.00g050200.m01.CDS01 [Cosmosporella sp. VM-42]